ncbi:hypothetical protein ACH3VR_16670 [Microbacterium sp. B2969]|uniref:SnoaL-like domain-containing protein n=1 Tax=Microbacterium alkaliflavum TaxID=3248839 RepID=A0ABW7QBG4_9MICO
MKRPTMRAVEPEPRLTGGRSRGIPGLIALMTVTVMVATTAGCSAPASSSEARVADPTPAPAPDPARTADLDAAQAMAAAFADHDVGAAAQYLAPDAELWDGWIRHWERDSAWSVEVAMEPCVEMTPTSWATEFTCPFAMHLMGSREVGAGPFLGNALTVRVADGKVLSAHRKMPSDTNGLAEHLDSVYAWLEANHPADVAFLGTDELAVAEDRWPGWLELWTQYLAEYIAATGES